MKTYNNTRNAIFGELYEIALSDPNVVILAGDVDTFMAKEFKEKIPKQFFNVGVAEQNTICVAAGLALSGKHVFIFSIANFITLRCYEQIKIDICCMELPVTILGTGTGYAYSTDGPTHYMTENVSIMRALPNMTIWCPSDYVMTASTVHLAYQTKGPSCILFDKGPFAQIYNQNNYNFSDGLSVLKPGKDVTIITTGIMTSQGLILVDELKKHGISAGLIDLYRLKPVNKKLLIEKVKSSKRIVTIEEHTVIGGLGSIVNEILAENGVSVPIKILGIPDICRREAGSREMLRSLDGLDISGLSKAILEWCKSGENKQNNA